MQGENCQRFFTWAQGGRLAYFGPPDKAKAYFTQNDFAEIYTALEVTEENPNAPEEAEARFKLSDDYQEYIVRPRKDKPEGTNGHQQAWEIKRPRRGNPWKQFTLLTLWHMELLENNVSNLFILILQAPFILAMTMSITVLFSQSTAR